MASCPPDTFAFGILRLIALATVHAPGNRHIDYYAIDENTNKANAVVPPPLISLLNRQ